MSKQISVLYIEDSQSDFSAIEGLIKDALSELPGNPQVEVTHKSNPEDARTVLDAGGQYDFYFVDLDFNGTSEDKSEEKPHLHGLPLIGYIRRHQKDAVIIVISSAGEDAREDAKDKGADISLGKRKLFRDPDAIEYIKKACLKALEKHSSEHVITDGLALDYDQSNLPLAASIGYVREQTLKSILFKWNNDLKEVKVDLISGGYSGAKTFAVNSEDKKKILLKMDRDPNALKREFDASGKIQDLPNYPNDFILPLDSRFKPKDLDHAGWSAVITPLAADVETLESWLKGRSITEEQIHDLCYHLFVAGGMKQVCASTKKQSQRPINAYVDTFFNQGRKAGVFYAIQEFGELVEKIEGLSSLGELKKVSIKYNAAMISNLIDTKSIAGINSYNLPSSTLFCEAHGDLHARNILVKHDPKYDRIHTYLIDFSNHENLPRAADLARLMVHFFASNIDAGAKSHQWGFMQQWLLWLEAFLTRDSLVPIEGSAPTTKNTLILLSWVQENINDILPEMPAWEFSLAVSIELLRLTYLDSLPMPKRVFGLLGANVALRLTSMQFNGEIE